MAEKNFVQKPKIDVSVLTLRNRVFNLVSSKYF